MNKNNYYNSNILFAAVSALIVFVIVLDVYMFRNTPALFWLTFPFLLVVSGLTIGKLMQIRKNEYWFFEQLGDEIIRCGEIVTATLPIPAVVVNSEGEILWANERFKECMFIPNENSDCSIFSVIGKKPLVYFNSDGYEIQYNDQCYRVYGEVRSTSIDISKGTERQSFSIDASNMQLDEDNQELTILYFDDVTDYKKIQTEYENSRPVVMIAVVDNYEELIDGAENIENDLNYKVDALLKSFFNERNAMLRKVSGSKYVIVVENLYLQEMIKDEFNDFRNRVHEIKINEKTVTLSIGVGTTAKNLAESERFAGKMLDIALKLGGDQAVVKLGGRDSKTGENGYYKSYGRSSEGRERRGNAKIRSIADAIGELIKTADTVYIMGHSNSDFDSAGAAIGFAAAVRRAFGKPAYAVINARSEEETNAMPLIERFINCDSYTNPIVLPPEIARNDFTDKSVLVIVDTHVEFQVDDKELFKMSDGSRRVVIDHHRLSQGAIEDMAVDCHYPDASSASELVTEIIGHFVTDIGLNVDTEISKLEAEALLAGIMLDTKDFVMRSGPDTFEAAAYLRKRGADTTEVKRLFDTTIEEKTKRYNIISSATIYHGCCAIAIVKEPIAKPDIVCGQAADDMLFIRGVEASFTIFPVENNKWKISARSIGGNVNVKDILDRTKYSKEDAGGGHFSMAAAVLKCSGFNEVNKRLCKAIDKYFTPPEIIVESDNKKENTGGK